MNSQVSGNLQLQAAIVELPYLKIQMVIFHMFLQNNINTIHIQQSSQPYNID